MTYTVARARLRQALAEVAAGIAGHHQAGLWG
jgi:hypothetical protein